ncbi:MAG: hypothetical protein OSJ70_08565 [Bacilli bacterium]|nr:hypothetical protein [Bacilli bacterium]
MKKKWTLLGSLITIMALTVLGVISISSNKKEEIFVKDLSFYTKRATIIREDISSIKDEKCKSSLDAMLTRINETHFTKNITIEEYYNAYYKDDKPFINFYEDVVTSCALDGNLDEIYVLVLSASNYPNEIKKRYLLSHEFVIKDRDSRRELYKSTDEIGTYTTKALELQIINDLIKVVKKK